MRAALTLLVLTACSGRDIVLGDGPLLEPLSFAEPVGMPGIAESGADDDDPAFASDTGELFFNSNRAGGEDIWSTQLSADGDVLGAPQPVADLNSDARETGLAVSSDGLELWFSSDREGSLDVFRAVRDQPGGAWGAPTLVAELSGQGDDLVSSISVDFLEVWLARREGTNGDYALLVARREDAAAPWQPPQPVTELDTEGAESGAFPLRDGLALVFTKDEDLVLATRSDPSAPFGAAEPLQELNSESDDSDFWVSAELDRAFFSSDREGQYRLYRTERVRD